MHVLKVLGPVFFVSCFVRNIPVVCYDHVFFGTTNRYSMYVCIQSASAAAAAALCCSVAAVRYHACLPSLFFIRTNSRAVNTYCHSFFNTNENTKYTPWQHSRFRAASAYLHHTRTSHGNYGHARSRRRASACRGEALLNLYLVYT